MKKLLYTTLIISFFSLHSCEDKIDLDLKEGRTQIVLDAFISNDNSIQTLRVSNTAAYFLNASTPGISDAIVSIEGPNGKTYSFSHTTNGNYTYDPATNGPIDSIGFKYKLKLKADDKEFMATSTLNPVPEIDSMTFDLEEEEPGAEAGYYTQFWARDFAGTDDFYWIKSFKNGKPVDTLSYAQYNLSRNAAFGGLGGDGFIFILPIRAAITNEDEPFEIGDTNIVELYSLNQDVWNYLIQVSNQANNGGLFATPTANIRTNITDIAGQVQDEAVGVFSIMAVNRDSVIIQ